MEKKIPCNIINLPVVILCTQRQCNPDCVIIAQTMFSTAHTNKQLQSTFHPAPRRKEN